MEPLLEPAGLLGGKVLKANRREQGITLLADTFEVNPVVARIRLQELFPTSSEAQLPL
jgi:hypothetical protein